MGCTSKTLNDTKFVWTKLSGTGSVNDAFVPFFEMETTRITDVKASFVVGAATANLQVQPALQYSNDREAWYNVSGTQNACTTFGGGPNASTSWTWGTTYTAPSVAYRYVRFGMKGTVTSSATAPQMGWVTLLLDVRE